MEDIRKFIELLDKNNQLLRVPVPISSTLEITEFTDRICKGPPENNKAILFESVDEFGIQVLINAFGSAERMAMALGVPDLNALTERLQKLLDLTIPKSIGESFNRGQEIFSAIKSIGLKSKTINNAPVQEVIETDKPSLAKYPILHCWPKDGGRFITLPQVVTHNPKTGVRNVGMYRLQVVADDKLLVHWQRHKGGAEHERIAHELNSPGIKTQTIPSAIVIGGDPASIWCASAPLPPEIDEYHLAGYLRGSPLEFTQCVTQPIKVPAHAEIVIEGTIDTNKQQPEGPFGDHTGYYTPIEPFPVFNITAITSRKNPIYPTTIVGIPPMEDAWMGKATERLFLPLLRLFLPEIVDINMPPSGVFHNLIIVSIKKRYPGHARKVIHGLWGMALLSLTKAIVIVDDWVDVQNLNQSSWQTLGNVDWEKDVILSKGPVDHLDHASYSHSFGGKIGIDATAKFPDEGYTRGWPEVLEMSTQVKVRVDKIFEKLKLS